MTTELAASDTSPIKRRKAHSRRYAEIKEAAIELFATRGYLATTMEQIGEQVGIRGPSLYRHVQSKHDLLYDIISSSLEVLLGDQMVALNTGDSTAERFRLVVESQVHFHTARRLEAFVGVRELNRLEGAKREAAIKCRRLYITRLEGLIQSGVSEGIFDVPSARLAAYAILDMGIGVATWFRSTGPYSDHEMATVYGKHALRLVGYQDPPKKSKRREVHE
jgi:AcrR family transcriptional regulator